MIKFLLTPKFRLAVTLLLMLLSGMTRSYAQCGSCTATTIPVDLSSQTDTTWSLDTTRNGNCCTGSNCIRFNVLLNPASDLLSFDVVNPSPSGSAFYQINCGPQISIGTPACITGLTSICITYCKPGGDSPDYIITATRTVNASPNDTVRVGCTSPMSVTGLMPASIQWTSIFPGTPGQYNSYLSCTAGCATTNVTPTSTTPAFIDYMVSGTPNTSCPGTSRDTVRVYVVPGLTLSMNPTSAVLCSAGPGTVTLTANPVGGQPPYSYAWSTGATTQSITVNSAGTYTVGVTDLVTNCPPITGSVVVTAAATPATPVASSNSPVCLGSTINLASSLIAGATYSWTGPSAFTSTAQNPTRPGATAAMAGTYSVTAIANGCTSSVATTTVAVNPIPATPTASSNSPVCTGNTLTLSTPAVAGATYTWTGPNSFSSTAQNPTIPAVTASANGTYSVTVTVGGCTSLAGTVAVTVNTTPAAPTASSNSPVCAGSTLNLTASVIAGATYSWTGPNSFSSSLQNPSIAGATVAATGTYSVTASVGGCTSTFGTTTVTVNPIPSAPTPGSNSPICSGSTLTLTTTAVAGATYTWTGPNSFSSSVQNPTIAAATTAATGTYSLTVTVNGCTSAAGTVAVTVNATPAAPTAASNSPVCAGSTLNLTASAIAGATYSWTGPNSFSSSLQNPSIGAITAAGAGTYSVTATVAGCTGTSGTTSVVVNPIPATPTASSNSPICVGEALNLTTSAVAGGTYSWTGPNSFTSSLQNPTIAGATAAASGTYSLTVTVNGCTSAAGTVAVAVNSGPATPVVSSNSPVCVGSPLNLTSNFVSGATYAWTGPNSFSSSVQNPTIASPTTAATGTYTLIIDNGCASPAATVSVVVNPVPAAPSASSNTPICAGSTLNLNASAIAGATYNWTGPNSFTASVQNTSIVGATIAASGTYSVAATVNGCTSAFGTTTVVVNPVPAAPAPGSNSPVCTGSTITLTTTPVAGATYSWTGPGGYASSVQNPTRANATLAMAGTYSLTVTVNGCTSAAGTVTVVVNATPAAPTATSNSPLCVGSTLNLTASNIAGATYTWTGPGAFSSTTQNPSLSGVTAANAGTYSVTATVAGCTGTAGTTAVVVNPIPATPTAASNSPICVGEALNLTTTAVAGATYSWNGPNSFTSASQNPTIPAATIAANGTYSLTITVNGCTSAAGAVVVTVNSAPATPVVSSNSPVCAGSPLNLTSNFVSGAIYTWTGPNSFSSSVQNPTIASPTTAATGTYTLIIDNGCASPAATVSVVVNPTPAAPTASSNTPICDGSTLTLNASNIAGATYSWTGPNSFISSVQSPSIPAATIAASGTYSVTATVNGCTSVFGTTTVVVNPIPATPAPGSNSPVCTGTTLTLTTTPVAGATYSWTGPGGYASSAQNPTRANATMAMAGTYSLTVTVNGCTSAAGTVAVVINATPAAPTATSNSPVCAGSTLNLTASNIAGATYAWSGPGSFSSTAQNPSISGVTALNAGTYSVTATVAGCSGASGTTAVVVNPVPSTPAASSNSPICIGANLNLTTTAVAGATYSWSGPNGFASSSQNPTVNGVTAADAGTYSLTITVNGCTSNAGTVNVIINSPPTAPTLSSNSPVCTGQTLNLNASLVIGATYSWTGPNSFSSSQQNPSISNVTLAAAGTYSLVVNNGCASTPVTITVAVNPTPAAPTASSNSPICDGSNIALTASAVAGGAYSWSGPSAFSSSLQNPTITGATLTDAGTYSVNVTVNGCTSANGTTNVVVNPIPAAPSPSSNSPVCTGTTLSLSAPAISGATYSWTGPNSFSSTSQNPNIANATLAANGTYTLTVTVNGCTSAQGTVVVTVNPTPAAPTAASNSPICDGDALNLTAGTVAGATYNWTGPNAFTSSSQNPTIAPATLTEAGTYSVTVTVAGCTGPAGTTPVIVHPIPATPAPSSNGPICIGQTLNLSTAAVAGATYAWNGPNSFTSSLQNPTIAAATAAASGTYSLTVTVNGCTSAEGTVVVLVSSNPPSPSTSSNSPVCTGQTIMLSADTIAGATYSWTGPNSFSSNLQNPTIAPATAAAAGTYTVVVFNGCASAPATVSVTVNQTPATPNPNSNSPVCEGSTISLTVAFTPGATYSWNGPNGFTASTANASVPNATSAEAGTYSLTITVNGCTSNAGTELVDVDPTPLVSAGTSQVVCANNAVVTLGATSTTGSGTWSTSGSGTFTPAQNLLNPTYTPSAADTTAGSVTLTFTSTSNGACPAANDQITITFTDAPTANAGADQTVCANNAEVNLNGSVTIAGGGNWTSSGTGSFSPTSNTLNATYTPDAADTAAGTVTLYLTTTQNGGCLAAIDSMIITITDAPVVDAGSTVFRCSNNPNGQLNGSSTTGSGTWTTSGTGTFNPNANTLNATYIPSAADVTAGSVQFTLTSTANGLCTAVTDTVSIVYTQPPVVTAGADMTVCANALNVVLSGTSTTNNGTWTTSGTGTFSPNGLNAIYNPSNADTAAGMVTLTLTSTNNGGCIAVTDQLVLTITDGPVALAGNDISVCSNNATVNLNGNIAVATGGVWSTNGTGTFSPSTSDLNATYTPTAADTASGTITIYLTTTGNGLCNPTVDSLIVTFTDAPYVAAGDTILTCISSPNTPLSGTSTTGSGTWSTLGSGTFSPNNTTLNATYVPSTADTAAGSVLLVLTSANNGSCLSEDDTVLIIFGPVPVVTTTPDQTVCANNATILIGATSTTNTGFWTTSGSGTFTPSNTNLNPTYTPSAADTAAGSVTLTFTSTNGCTPIASTITLTITDAPVVNGGPDLFTCANNPNAFINATVSGATTTGVWTTSGGGFFSPSNTDLNPTYLPDAGDIAAGAVTLVLTSTGNGLCLAEADTVLLTITPPPTATAGADLVACANNPVALGGTIAGGNGTGIWSTPNGAGTFSPNATDLNASYTPTNDDTLASPVMIILTSTNNGGCLASSDTLFIIVNPGPEVSAGPDQTVCANNSAVALSGTVYLASGISWSSSGDGTFSPDSLTLNTTYTPGVLDTANGNVTIFITSTGNGLCNAAVDSMIITITDAPLVNAGTDQSICNGIATATLNGSVGGSATSAVWTTSGTGTFSPDDSTLNATYNISPADTLAGSVTLYLTTTNNGLCVAVMDSMVLTMTPLPLALAGNDTAMCANESITLNGSILGGNGTGVWSTSGDGTFTPDDSTLNAVYTPGPLDTANGTVTFILNATNSCLPESDTVVVTILSAPAVSAGNAALICAGETVPLGGSVSNTTGGTWSTSGDGTFTPNANALNATYIPGPGDISAGTVNVTLAADSTGFCSSVSDAITITINSKPVAEFYFANNCEAAATVFADSSTNVNGAITAWNWNFGSGTDTAQHPAFTFASTGTQTVTLIVSTAAGCSDTLTQTLMVNPAPVAFFTSDTACLDATFADSSFIAQGAIVSWSWTFGDSMVSNLQDPVHTYLDSGAFVVTLTVVSDSGCVAVFSDTTVLELCTEDITAPVLPSAFTPNGDGHNDFLIVRGGPLIEMELKVYNEWGNLVFTSDDQSVGWDGTYKGKPQPAGTYVWTLTGTTADGEPVNTHGSVTILR